MPLIRGFGPTIAMLPRLATVQSRADQQTDDFLKTKIIGSSAGANYSLHDRIGECSNFKLRRCDLQKISLLINFAAAHNRVLRALCPAMLAPLRIKTAMARHTN